MQIYSNYPEDMILKACVRLKGISGNTSRYGISNMICFMVSSDLVDKSRYRQMGGARVPRVPVGLPLG